MTESVDMDRARPTPRDWAAAMLSLVWGCLVVSLLEVGFGALYGVSRAVSDVGLVVFLSGEIWTSSLALVATAVPFVAFTLLARRVSSRVHEVIWLLAACGFGFLWQGSVARGDGIASSPHATLLQAGLMVGGVVGMGGFAWLLLPQSPLGAWRRVLAGVALAVGATASLTVLTGYKELHGFLAVFVGGLAAYLVVPLLRRRWAIVVSAVLAVVLAGSVVPTLGDHATVSRYVQAYGHLPGGMIRAMPPLWWMEADLQMEQIDLDDATSDAIEDVLEKVSFGAFDSAQGDNVILIVVEALRSDVWADEAVAPSFQGWRHHGTWFPSIVAHYPATPLAYGAIFTSQMPSVIVQAPFWREHRLFDYLSGTFDEMILSQPNTSWFDLNAITDFFMPSGVKVHEHSTAKAALLHLKKRIQGLDEGTSFFAWTHLYEPHDKYVSHTGFDFGDDKKGRYLSEVAYVDHVLGEFMDWFYSWPGAEDTLVIVVGDHGEGLGEEILGTTFWGHHVHVHSVLSHVPLYLSGPSVEEDQVDETTPIGQIDLMPTIFDFVGEPLPSILPVQGQSIFALVDDPPSERPLGTEAFSIRGKKLFTMVSEAQWKDPESLQEDFLALLKKGKYPPKRGLEVGDTKLVQDLITGTIGVYDLSTDPYEEIDLAAADDDLLDDTTAKLTEWCELQAYMIDELGKVPMSTRKLLPEVAPFVVDEVPQGIQLVGADFGGLVELMGYTVEHPKVAPGGYATIRYYFRAKAPVPEGWRLIFKGKAVGKYKNLSHTPVKGMYPLQEWQPGDVIIDQHRFKIPKKWGRSKMEIQIQLYNPEAGKAEVAAPAQYKLSSDTVRVLTLSVSIPMKKAVSMPKKGAVSVKKGRLSKTKQGTKPGKGGTAKGAGKSGTAKGTGEQGKGGEEPQGSETGKGDEE